MSAADSTCRLCTVSVPPRPSSHARRTSCMPHSAPSAGSSGATTISSIVCPGSGAPSSAAVRRSAARRSPATMRGSLVTTPAHAKKFRRSSTAAPSPQERSFSRRMRRSASATPRSARYSASPVTTICSPAAVRARTAATTSSARGRRSAVGHSVLSGSGESPIERSSPRAAA